MVVDKNERILFTGDSITDCGRSRPVGMGEGLGDGYVSLVSALLSACYPDLRTEILNTGVSGDRVVDLEARWDRDVLKHFPDRLCILIGINDVWRQFDPSGIAEQVDIDMYERVYRGLLKRAAPVKKLVLMTPYYIQSDRSDSMRILMERYGNVVRSLAHESNAVFVDLQAAFDRYLKYQSKDRLCQDGIHPNRIGHMIIAKELLYSLGFDFSGFPEG